MGLFSGLYEYILEDDKDDNFDISADDNKKDEDDATVKPEEDGDNSEDSNTDDDSNTADIDSTGDDDKDTSSSPPADEDNDDFSISGDDSTDDTEDDSSTDEGDDSTDDTEGDDSTDDTEGDDSTDDTEDETSKMYDSLSDKDKENKNIALKGNYRELYMNCDTIIEKLNDIPKEIDDANIIGKVIISLSNLKSYIEYYLSNNFNNRTFIENDIMFNKYLSILNGIKNVIKDIQILVDL